MSDVIPSPVVPATRRRDARRPVDLLRQVPVAIHDAIGAVQGAAQEVVGRDTIARLGVELVGAMHVTRPVRIGLGVLLEEDDAVVLPLWWEDAEHPLLFPTVDGGVELRGDHQGTDVRMIGSYRAPLGPTGHFADGIGHRIVMASLEMFLTGVAARLVLAADDAGSDG